MCRAEIGQSRGEWRAGHAQSADVATVSSVAGATPPKRQPMAPPMTVCAANTRASGGVAVVTAARCAAAETSMGPTSWGAGSLRM